jgi:hypothetical protein
MSADKILFYLSRQFIRCKGYKDTFQIIPRSASEAFGEIKRIMESRSLSVDNVEVWNNISNETEPNLRSSIFKEGIDGSFFFVKPD